MKKSPALGILFLTIFIDLLGFGIVIPILPNYAEEVGGSEFMAGVVVTVFAVMAFLFTPIWGRLSDRYGRRPVIIVSTLISTISYLVFSQATTFGILLIARALAGVGSGNISAAQAFITDVTPPEKRAKSMGMIGAAFGLGFSIGPFLGGLIKTQWGFEYIGYFTAGLCLMNFVLALAILPESLKERNFEPLKLLHNIIPAKSIARVFRESGKRELFLIYIIYTTAFMMFQITAALSWKDKYDYSDSRIAYIFSFIGICTAVVQGGLVGIFTRKLGELKLLSFGTLLFMTSLALIPFVPVEWFVPFELLLLLSLAVANGMIGPASLSLLSQMTERKDQGKTLGLYQSVGSFGRIIGPVLGTALYELNRTIPFLSGSLILLINIYFAVLVARNYRARFGKGTDPA